jgi:sulfite exporter TauE/SafE
MQWLLIAAGGLLGSGHCIGMCGGFALMLRANRRGLAANVGRQCLLSLGRLFSYSFGGALSGYAGCG